MNDRPLSLHSRAGLVAMLISGAGLSACGSPASPLIVEEFTAVQASGTTCKKSDSISQNTVFSGGSAMALVSGITVMNSLSPLQGNATASVPVLTTDQHEAILESVNTSFKFTPSDGGAVVKLKPETHLVFGTIKTSSATTTVITTLLGEENGSLLLGRKGTLAITVTVKGHTLDGTNLSSPPVVFPADVALGTPSCPAMQSIDPSAVCTISQPDGFNCK